MSSDRKQLVTELRHLQPSQRLGFCCRCLAEGVDLVDIRVIYYQVALCGRCLTTLSQLVHR